MLRPLGRLMGQEAAWWVPAPVCLLRGRSSELKNETLVSEPAPLPPPPRSPPDPPRPGLPCTWSLCATLCLQPCGAFVAGVGLPHP